MPRLPQAPRSGIREDRARLVPASVGSFLAIVAALLLGPAGPALAQTDLLASQGAWYWSSNEKVTTCGGGTCGALSIDDGPNVSGIGGPSNSLNPISPGHVAVSMKNGSSDMRAYVKFDLAPLMRDVPFGSKIEFGDFIVRMTVSQPTDPDHRDQHGEFDGRPPATTNQSSAALMACAVTTTWAKAEGDPTTSTTILPPDQDAGRDEVEITTDRNEPIFDCGRQALGALNKTGDVWSFDITEIANQWAAARLDNWGIAIVPVDQSVASTWTVELHGPALTVRDDESSVVVVPEKLAARAEVSFLVVPDDGTPQGPPGTPGPQGPPGPPTIVPPSIVTGGDGGTVAPPQGGPIVRVSNSGPAETPAWLYSLIPLGLLGLGLTSSAINAEAGGVSMSHRVAQTLRARRLHAGAAPQTTDQSED